MIGADSGPRFGCIVPFHTELLEYVAGRSYLPPELRPIGVLTYLWDGQDYNLSAYYVFMQQRGRNNSKEGRKAIKDGANGS